MNTRALNSAVVRMTEQLCRTQFRRSYRGENELIKHMTQQGWNPGKSREYFLGKRGRVDFEHDQVGIEVEYAKNRSGLIEKLLTGFWQILPYRVGRKGVLLLGVCGGPLREPLRLSEETREAMDCIPAKAFSWSITDCKLLEM